MAGFGLEKTARRCGQARRRAPGQETEMINERNGATAAFLAMVVLFSLFPFHDTAGANSGLQPPDPKPPQVSVGFFFPPSPLIQYGTPRLVYEMRISNYIPL